MSAIAQARLYLEKLPKGAAEGDVELHEAIAHLSAVLTAIDECNPTGYVLASALRRLKEPHLVGVWCAIGKQSGEGLVAVYTVPVSEARG